MDIKQENDLALSDFRRSVKNFKQYSRDGIAFNGKVIYEAFNETFKEEFRISISFNFCTTLRLDIDEKGRIIKSDRFHMDFETQYNTTIFKFNKEENCIIIEGNSPKVGKHKVYIYEV